MSYCTCTFVERRSGSEMERLILDVRLQAVGVQPKESIQDITESDNEIQSAMPQVR